MASSHTSYGRLIMLFASLDASCLWFTQIHTHTHIIFFLFLYTCVFHIRMLKAFHSSYSYNFFFHRVTQRNVQEIREKKNIYLNVENRDYYEENVWQLFFCSFSLRFFCVFTQAIIVKINENDRKYEEKFIYVWNTTCFMIFP